MKMKLLLKLCISFLKNPRGVFTATREEGGQALAQNTAGAAAILRPRVRRFEPRAVPFVPCQALCPILSLQPLIFTESAL